MNHPHDSAHCPTCGHVPTVMSVHSSEVPDCREAVIHAARYITAMQDGPRDDYYSLNMASAWRQLREALVRLDAASGGNEKQPPAGRSPR